MYRNSEHYPDPTAGEAMRSIARQERDEKETEQKQKTGTVPKVYICSPFAGDTERNIEKARHYCRFAVRQGCVPYASHLFFPQFLSDDDPAQRALGLRMGLIYLQGCTECWVFGKVISSGMAVEIKRAKECGIVLRLFTEQCKEVT